MAGIPNLWGSYGFGGAITTPLGPASVWQDPMSMTLQSIVSNDTSNPQGTKSDETQHGVLRFQGTKYRDRHTREVLLQRCPFVWVFRQGYDCYTGSGDSEAAKYYPATADMLNELSKWSFETYVLGQNPPRPAWTVDMAIPLDLREGGAAFLSEEMFNARWTALGSMEDGGQTFYEHDWYNFAQSITLYGQREVDPSPWVGRKYIFASGTPVEFIGVGGIATSTYADPAVSSLLLSSGSATYDPSSLWKREMAFAEQLKRQYLVHRPDDAQKMEVGKMYFKLVGYPGSRDEIESGERRPRYTTVMQDIENGQLHKSCVSTMLCGFSVDGGKAVVHACRVAPSVYRVGLTKEPENVHDSGKHPGEYDTQAFGMMNMLGKPKTMTLVH